MVKDARREVLRFALRTRAPTNLHESDRLWKDIHDMLVFNTNSNAPPPRIDAKCTVATTRT
jgi:hypothetical protein